MTRAPEKFRDERLSLMVESARLGVWDWNIQTGELLWSKGCLEMFGLPADTKMSYERFLEVVHPEDRERVDRAVQIAAKTGEEYSTEMRSVWPDGSVHWIASRGRVYFDRAGAPIRMSGAGMDVTQFKEIEENLQRARAESKAQADNLAAVLDAVPAITFLFHDREGQKVTSNRAAHDLLRAPYGSNPSLLGEKLGFVLLENGEPVPKQEQPVRSAAASGIAVRGKELEVRFEDGSSVFIFGHAVPLHDEAGQVRGAVGAFLDITDRKVMEERLRAANERFQVALRSTPITVFAQGTDLRYKWVHNPVGGHLTSEIIGKRDTDLLENAEDAATTERIKRDVLRTGRSYQGEMAVTIKGARRYYHVNIDPQRDAKGRINGLTGASFDLTDRKRAEAEREELSRQRQLALDAVKMGWWRLDIPTMLGRWDDTFKEIFGMTQESGPGEHFLKVIHADDLPNVTAKFQAAMDANNPAPYSVEHRILRPDGSVRWVEAYGAAEFEGEGESRRAISLAGIVRDITERKEADEARRASETRYRELAENLDRQVQERTHELQERNEDVVRSSEGLRELSGRLLQIQDEERRRVARDLHDSTGQIVTALDLELQSLMDQIRKIAPQLTKKAESAAGLVQQLHKDIRTTSYLLHPPLLDETGLYSAINWYVQGVTERSGIQVQLDMAPGFGRVPREIELAVFRLVQECLTNIHRHSGSQTAVIRLTRDSGAITVEVRDHGQGMPPEKLAVIQSGGSGVGIRGMRERLHQMHGELRIESNRSGTRVWASIPIPRTNVAENESEDWLRAAM